MDKLFLHKCVTSFSSWNYVDEALAWWPVWEVDCKVSYKHLVIQITETTGQEQQNAKGQGYDAGKCRSRSSKPQASEDGGDHSLTFQLVILLSSPELVIFVPYTYFPGICIPMIKRSAGGILSRFMMTPFATMKLIDSWNATHPTTVQLQQISECLRSFLEALSAGRWS
jgi:hypothetical protein